MTVLLILSLAANAALAIIVIRVNRALKATRVVNAGLVHEIDRKLGERKAQRLVRSMTTQLRQARS